MKKFGILNGCYWMLLNTMEDVVEHMEPLYLKKNLEYVINSLQSGKVIAINKACGFHAGNMDDYTDIVEAEAYPQVELV